MFAYKNKTYIYIIMSIQFQYFSDVHTEMLKSNPKKILKLDIQPLAPYLILAGDIGDPFSQVYYDFLEMLAKKFEKIFLISGNHEYYETNCARHLLIYEKEWMDKVDEKIRAVCDAIGKVVYLQDEVYDMEGSDISIFGATFWSDIRSEERMNILYSLMDYQKIPGFDIGKGIAKHKRSCGLLERHIAERSDRRFIVISHHLPSYELIDDRYKRMCMCINSAYATDIAVAAHPNIVAWVAGHTHIPIQKRKFYVNPIGYPGEDKYGTDFNKVLVV
jgi:predicted phosphodiesterase